MVSHLILETLTFESCIVIFWFPLFIFGAPSLIVGVGIRRFMYDGVNGSYQEVSENGDNGGSTTEA